MTNASNQNQPPVMNDELAMKLAETTDLSPNQALALIEEHGRDLQKLQRIAETMKAEG
ncbi:MAG: hypothetical protein ACXIVF_19530 [Rhizobiaceae bacterium]